MDLAITWFMGEAGGQNHQATFSVSAGFVLPFLLVLFPSPLCFLCLLLIPPRGFRQTLVSTTRGRNLLSKGPQSGRPPSSPFSLEPTSDGGDPRYLGASGIPGKPHATSPGNAFPLSPTVLRQRPHLGRLRRESIARVALAYSILSRNYLLIQMPM